MPLDGALDPCLSCRVLALFCAVDFLDFMPPPKLLLLSD